MSTMYVLFSDNLLVGIYSSHRKATQTMYLETIRDNLKLDRYTFDFGIETFYFVAEDGTNIEWCIHEADVDCRL